VLSFLLFYGAGAMFFGLAAIVGAYFAGVALDEVFFENPDHEDRHDKPVEHFVDGLITGFGPIFFVYAGCIVDPSVFLDLTVLAYGLAFTLIAALGKLACGLVVSENRFIVGVGMIPRGEVGIVFATIGLQTGVLTQELFGASMIMVLLTTVVTPIGLNALIKRQPKLA
jgi:Kef-type K+ transport system membrane component KefB